MRRGFLKLKATGFAATVGRLNEQIKAPEYAPSKERIFSFDWVTYGRTLWTPK